MLTDEIREAWPTAVWVGLVTLLLPDVDDVVAYAGGEGEAESNTGKLAAAIEEIGSGFLDGSPLRWRHSVESFGPGDHVAVRYGVGSVVAACFLTSEGGTGQTESGQMILHDPRTGAGHVSLPGLPWARPLNVPPEPGRVAVFPGWLAHSIAPLHRQHRMTVWWAVGESE